MSEICDKCGLPKDICACGEISKQQARLVIRSEKRRYGKPVTLVEGLESDQKEIMKKLKAKLACGGTLKDGAIELQGAHIKRAKELLVDLGFPENTIEAS
jgi:translation initiation factor 1